MHMHNYSFLCPEFPVSQNFEDGKVHSFQGHLILSYLSFHSSDLQKSLTQNINMLNNLTQ